jgi:short-subunit dehydrogenase
MKKLVKFEKHKLARTFIQMAGRLPVFRRALKSLIHVKYFISPAVHLKSLRHFQIIPEKEVPAIRYPEIEERPEFRKLAIVTGATSGIGKEFARCFARQGYDLLITGRRMDIITGVAYEIRKDYGVRVRIVIADLSVKEDVASLLQIVGQQNNIEVLVNNAGYGMKLSFSKDEIERQLDMISVHVDVPLMLIHKVLPGMIERRSGTIINVSSMAAYFPASGSTTYICTKSFLKSFSESLHLEVGRYGIRVQCLCPGFTFSDFHRNLDMLTNGIQKGWIPWMQPDDVVQVSLDYLDKGKIICIPGFLNRLLVLLASVIPRGLYYRLSLKLEKKVRRRNDVPAVTLLQ